MKKRIIRAFLSTLIITSLMASIMSFVELSTAGKSEKMWEIELIMEGGNSGDFAFEITSIEDGKKVNMNYDLEKDKVPQGKIIIEVKDKDDLKTVLVTRDDAPQYEAHIVISEKNASTDKVIKKKTFDMPPLERELLIVWND